MTPQEFHFDFRLLCDEIEALANKSFTHAEIDWLLNRSQDTIVRNRLNQNNVLAAGVEMNQKRIDDLKGILVKFPEQPEMNLISHDDGLIYELDLSNTRHTYYYYIRGLVQVRQKNCDNWVSIKIIQHDDLNESLKDPFNKSSKSDILANFGRSTMSGNSSLYFYPDLDQVLTKVRLEYLKKPNRINIGTYTYIDGSPAQQTNTDLSEHLHQEIVNQAVKLAAGIMKDPNLYQAMMAEIQTQE